MQLVCFSPPFWTFGVVTLKAIAPILPLRFDLGFRWIYEKQMKREERKKCERERRRRIKKTNNILLGKREHEQTNLRLHKMRYQTDGNNLE